MENPTEHSFSDAQVKQLADIMKSGKKSEPHWMNQISVLLSIAVFIGGMFGVWLSASNKATALDVRVTSVESTMQKNSSRLDVLETARATTSNSAQQIIDLKESFDKFQIQNREDWRDIKIQIQELQDRRK